jgi:hypothetical protein
MMFQKQAPKRKKGIAFMLEYFKDHIGEANGVSIKDIFDELFEGREHMSAYELYFKFQGLQRLFNYMRKKTNAFIVLKGGLYFIVQTHEEAKEYIERLHNTKKQIDFMIKKCGKAIDEQRWEKL